MFHRYARRRAAVLGAGFVMALAIPVAVAHAQTGYDIHFCSNIPATGLAIRAGDNDGATELGRVYHGNVGHIYATSKGEPSINPGWATGYGRESDGTVVHGYFKVAYTSPNAC
jgi:hypothetical protein